MLDKLGQGDLSGELICDQDVMCSGRGPNAIGAKRLAGNTTRHWAVIVKGLSYSFGLDGSVAHAAPLCHVLVCCVH